LYCIVNCKQQQSRPQRRRLEVLTTDAKIIRVISRRVAIFPTAAARQMFDGDCDAANLKKIPSDIAGFSTLWVPR